MLFHVDFLTAIITETDNTYEVDGYINPTFFNDGETDVRINHQLIQPGEAYRVDIPNGVLRGKFNISFKDEVGKNNMVIVNYGLYGGPFADPNTGAVITENSASTMICN